MKSEFFYPKYWLLWTGLSILKLLTFLPYPIIMSIGKALGLLLFYTVKHRRHIVETNIMYCFPNKSRQERQQLVKENFIHMGYTLVENPVSWWASDQRIQKRAEIIGMDNLQNTLDSGKGVLLLSAHFTALEMGGRIITHHIPLTFMYRQHKNKLFEWLQKQSREGKCEKMIERKDVLTTIKALRCKKPVWYAADQDYGRKHSVFAPFFNVNAASITATGKLSKLGKAVVVPFFTYRNKDASGYIVELLPQLENYPTGDPIIDATIINQVFEKAIKKAPEQYLWAHRRFKTRPEGEPDFYK